jgi:hypothetical protein
MNVIGFLAIAAGAVAFAVVFAIGTRAQSRARAHNTTPTTEATPVDEAPAVGVPAPRGCRDGGGVR